MASPEEAYEGLFRGAARLGALCAGLDVPYPHVDPLRRSERLKDYFELSVDPRGRSLGIMTRGEGQRLAFRVTRFMEENGIPEQGLRRFLVRAKVFEYKNIFFKVEADAQGMREFSTYFRRRPTLDVAHACLADAGVNAADVGLMEAVAEVLEKETVHFGYGRLASGGTHGEGVLLPARRRAGTGFEQRRRCDPTDAADCSLWTLTGVSCRDAPPLVSLGYANGELLPGLKLDIHGVDPLIVRNLLSDPEQRHRADLARAPERPAPSQLCGHPPRAGSASRHQDRQLG